LQHLFYLNASIVHDAYKMSRLLTLAEASIVEWILEVASLLFGISASHALYGTMRHAVGARIRRTKPDLSKQIQHHSMESRPFIWKSRRKPWHNTAKPLSHYEIMRLARLYRWANAEPNS